MKLGCPRKGKRKLINGVGNVYCDIRDKTVNVKADCMNCENLFGVFDNRVNCKNNQEGY